jgi:formamidopyrimidine-DNA glycosylase
MPELPEVETIARGLAKRVTGDVIESVWLGSKPEPLKSPAREIAATLENSRISGVRRMGKHIVIELQHPDSGSGSNKTPKKFSRKSPLKIDSHSACAQWIVHLGMTGSMVVCPPDAATDKHTHLIAKLASGRELRFVDPRRFGRLSVSRNGDFEAGGFEPLDVDREKFVGLFRGRKTPIKSALLNQKLLRGVGNIYADEALFRAGIRPRRQAASLSREQLGKLYTSVQKVLKEAIALGGSSISDFVDADGDEGFFQLQQTPVKRVVIAGRSSHYCPKCQK